MRFLNNNKVFYLALAVCAIIFFFAPFGNFTFALTTTSPTPTPTGLFGQDCSGAAALSPDCVGVATGNKIKPAIETVKATAGCLSDPVVCVQVVVTWWMSSIIAAVGMGIAYMAYVLIYLVQNLPTAPPNIIYSIWQFIRNFINLFFILILIVIAFATIFDIQKYNYRELLVRLILVALLINFSHVIASTAFSVGNQISVMELNSIKGSTENSFENLTHKVADGIQNKVMFIGKDKNTAASTGYDGSVKLLATFQGGFMALFLTSLFNLIFLLGMFLAFAYAALSFLIRVPLIWLLEILSPLAFFAIILPSTRKHFKKWWTEVISLAFAPAVFIFFMAMAAAIFAARGQDTSFPDITSINSVATAADFFKNLLALQDLVYYIVALAALGGGIYASRKLGNMMGSTTVAWAGKAQNAIAYRSYLKPRVEGAGAGLKARYEDRKERGIGLYKGTRGRTETTARWAERFGGKAAKGLLSQAELKNYNEAYSKVRQRYDNGEVNEDQIRDMAKKSISTPEGYAARKMMGELGLLDDSMFEETVESLQNNPAAVNDFIKNSSEKGKLAEVSGNTIIEMAAAEGRFTSMITNKPARKALYRHIQANPKLISLLNAGRIQKAVDIFGGAGTAEGGAFLKDVGKVRPDLTADYTIANLTAYNATHPATPKPILSREQYISNSLKNAENIANMPLTVWTNVDFRRALWDEVQARTAGRARDNYINNLNEEIRKSEDTDPLTRAAGMRLHKQTEVAHLVGGPRP